MWNSRIGVSRIWSASANTSSSVIVYAPSSFGGRANEQKTHVARRMQMFVGLMCWLATKKTRSPFLLGLTRSASAPIASRSFDSKSVIPSSRSRRSPASTRSAMAIRRGSVGWTFSSSAMVTDMAISRDPGTAVQKHADSEEYDARRGRASDSAGRPGLPPEGLFPGPAADGEADVVAPEAEGVAQGDVHFALHPPVVRVVEVTLRVRGREVDGGRNLAGLADLERDDRLDGARGAQQVARHGLGRPHDEPVRVVPEHRLHGQRLIEVVGRRRGPVRVDVVHILRRTAGVLERRPHRKLRTRAFRCRR